jgi:hypothetical protein
VDVVFHQTWNFSANCPFISGCGILCNSSLYNLALILLLVPKIKVSLCDRIRVCIVVHGHCHVDHCSTPRGQATGAHLPGVSRPMIHLHMTAASAWHHITGGESHCIADLQCRLLWVDLEGGPKPKAGVFAPVHLSPGFACELPGASSV